MCGGELVDFKKIIPDTGGSPLLAALAGVMVEHEQLRKQPTVDPSKVYSWGKIAM